jgi:hypothetical protein
MTHARVLAQFEADKLGISDQANAVGYNATCFLQLVRDHDGCETTPRLLAGDTIS